MITKLPLPSRIAQGKSWQQGKKEQQYIMRSRSHAESRSRSKDQFEQKRLFDSNKGALRARLVINIWPLVLFPFSIGTNIHAYQVFDRCRYIYAVKHREHCRRSYLSDTFFRSTCGAVCGQLLSRKNRWKQCIDFTEVRHHHMCCNRQLKIWTGAFRCVSIICMVGSSINIPSRRRWWEV